jgi:hypothetical protein
MESYTLISHEFQKCGLGMWSSGGVASLWRPHW